MNQIKLNYFLIFFLIAAAVISRVYGIWEWSFVTDEYTSLNKSEYRYNNTFNFASYLIIYLIQNIFGENEFNVRLPFALLGAFSIPILYVLWRKPLGEFTAALASIILLFSAWHLWHSQIIRYYSPIVFFAVMSYYFYYIAITQNSVRYLCLAFLSDACAIAFHLTAVFIPIGCGTFSMLVLLFGKRYFEDCSRRISLLHILVYGVGGLLALGFLLKSLLDWQSMGQEWGYGPFLFSLQLAKYIQFAVTITAVVGLFCLVLEKHRLGIFFLVATATPTVSFIFLSFFMSVRPDYLIYLFPLICLLSAYCCYKAYESIKKPKVLGYMLAVVVVMAGIPEFVSYYSGKLTHDVREIVEFMSIHHKKGDKIISYVNGFNYYANETYTLEKRPGYLYSNRENWHEYLDKYKNDEFKTWILLPVKNKKLNGHFQKWLFNNAKLVWRSRSKRFDYTLRGYEIFLVSSSVN